MVNGINNGASQQETRQPLETATASVSERCPETIHTPHHTQVTFRKAVKRDAKLRFAVIGPSGSGKTYPLLKLATELGGPIAVIDTERGSAEKYAELTGKKLDFKEYLLQGVGLDELDLTRDQAPMRDVEL